MRALLTCAVLALSAPVMRGDEFAEQLARLASPRAAERAAAERWLEAHLALERYPQVAEAARAGDAEVRGRLARVLGSDARHLGLALELCAQRDEALASLGRDALRAGVARSDPRLGEPPLRREPLLFALRRLARSSPPRNLRLDARLSLEEMVEVLECSGELPVGLTLDPRLATKTIRRDAAALVGPWEQVLASLQGAMGVVLDGYGLEPAGGEDEHGGFLRLVPESEGPRTGVEVLIDWLLVLATSQEQAARTRVACNLASSAFAPALAWMDQLVLTRGDAAAREGLLRAAARGHVARALRTPSVLEELLQEAESAGRAAHVLWALEHAPCLDEDGGLPAARLVAGLASASPRQRWARLHLLERQGCAAPEIVPAVRALLADPGTSPRLRLQALHTLAAQVGAGPAGDAAARLDELVPLGLDADELARLGRSLRALGLEPPCGEPARVPAAWSARMRLDLLQLWLWNGTVERIGAHLAAALVASGEPVAAVTELLADELRPWLLRGEGARVDGALARARELRPALAGALDRLQLLLGRIPPAQVADVLARGGWRLVGPEPDLALLAALGGYPAAIPAEGAARETLLSLLGAAQREGRALEAARPLLAALERAAQGLYAARRDEQGDAFSKSVRTAIRGGKGEIRRVLEGEIWPAAPGAVEIDLLRERARHEIPSDL